jgi:Tol biopolymer transport system component
MKAVDLFPASPLQDDFAAMLDQARDPATAVLRRTQDANHGSGLAAWGSIRTVRRATWALGPTLGDGRRILVEVFYDSTVYVARPDERARAVLRDVGADLASFAFAPSGKLLAFVAAGAGGQAAYVVDLAGKVVLGDAGALARGGPESGEIVTAVAWDADGKALAVEVVLPDGAMEQRRVKVREPDAPQPNTPPRPE